MNLKEWTEVIKNIGSTVALLGGGAWTIYTFSALGTVSKARLEQYRQAVVEITVEATQLGRDPSGRHMISAVAAITNKGTRNTFLDFREAPPFTIYRVDFNKRGVGITKEVVGVNCECDYLTLRAGITWKLPIFFTVADPGLYLIRFDARLNAVERKVHEDVANQDDEQSVIVWRGSTYVQVEELTPA